MRQYKVLAYITNQNRLLVFREPDFPEVGIQVPGGTIEQDEDPDSAVLREATEETGLKGLVVRRKLTVYDHHRAPDSIHERHVYHLQCSGNPPHSWTHYEQHSGISSSPIRFDFFWLELDSDPIHLAGCQGDCLGLL